jgi:LacI family transcriptional regulator
MHLITVIVNNVEGYARGILRGIMPFAFSRGWECRVLGAGLVGETDHFNRTEVDCDGTIVQAGSDSALSRLLKSGKPVVNVSSSIDAGTVPSVVCDDLAVGRLGAEHFLRLGFRQFIWYAPLDRHFAKLRQSGFIGRLDQAGMECRTAMNRHVLNPLLEKLSKPVAVMCCNDTCALEVLAICRGAGMKVPDQVAVLGVDNDDLMQSLAFPALSSIGTATEQIGFEAAALLERMMDGKPPAKLHIKIPPTRIIARRSTDLTAVGDPEVAEALRFIRQHAAGPLDVDGVLQTVTVSRRQLERRFRNCLGRSMLDEIRRCRLERARQLLLESDLTIPQIASASGFSSASYLTVVFGEANGETPGSFRRKVRRLGG